MNRLKVLMIDPSIMYRKMMKEAITSLVPKAVVHYAESTKEAGDKLASGNYQLVMLDTNADDDILQQVSEIRTTYPYIHLVLMGRSTKTNEAISAAAFDMGAFGYMVKPLHADYETNAQTIFAYFKDLIEALSHEDTPVQKITSARRSRTESMERTSLVVLAASTGGPSAIRTLLTGITEGCCPPILIVQHMPAAFTRSLAESLSQKSTVAVKEAEDGELPLPGHAYIAPGGEHMILRANGRIGLTKTSFVNGVRPSADVLFRSVAKVCKGEKILAVILTGMGKDGADGVEALKAACDCRCVVQNRDTCVVFGMPREVVLRGLADSEEDLPAISETISMLCDEGIAADDV